MGDVKTPLMFCSAMRSGRYWSTNLLGGIISKNGYTILEEYAPSDIMAGRMGTIELSDGQFYFGHFHNDDKNNYKCVFLTRDPRDQLVSLGHFRGRWRGGDLNVNAIKCTELILDGIEGGYKVPFRYSVIEQLKWINDDSVLKISYEKLKKDARKEVDKVVRFYGFDYGPEDIANGIDKATSVFNRRKNPKDHYRKGVVGDYRSLPEELINKIESKIGDLLDYWKGE